MDRSITLSIGLVVIIIEDHQIIQNNVNSMQTNTDNMQDTAMQTNISQWLVQNAGYAHVSDSEVSPISSDTLPFAQGREVRSITSVPFSFGAILPILLRTAKRSVFLITVPLYWLLIFNLILGYFDISLFLFIVGLSYVLSTIFVGHWGIIEWGMKG